MREAVVVVTRNLKWLVGNMGRIEEEDWPRYIVLLDRVNNVIAKEGVLVPTLIDRIWVSSTVRVILRVARGYGVVDTVRWTFWSTRHGNP